MNDDCDQALNIAVPGNVSVSLVGAADSLSSCNIHYDVWYRLVAPTDGIVEITTTGSYQVVLARVAVFADPSGVGSCGTPLEMLECGRDAWVSVTAGHSYLLQLGTQGADDALTTGLSLQYLSESVDDRYTLTLSDATAVSGGTAELLVTLDCQEGALGAPLNLRGWSLAVCHDQGGLELLSAEYSPLVATINNGNPPSLQALNVAPGYFYDGAVIDLFGVETLSPGVGIELYLATYAVNGPVGSEFPVSLCIGGSSRPRVVRRREAAPARE